jgi:hypothetical protein
MAAQPRSTATELPRAQAAVGWRAHSGWAQLIALAGPLVVPTVLARRRVELADRSMPGAVQPFHAARDLGPAAGEPLVARCRAASLELARQALRETRDELERLGYRLAACGLPQSSARPLPPFAAVLASHPLLHTAEGELFREVLAAAGAELGLTVVRVKEKELLDRCAAATGRAAADLQRHLADLGRTLGPPWRQDEKLATLAAWLALAESGKARTA